jgi:SnoaL-like domain
LLVWNVKESSFEVEIVNFIRIKGIAALIILSVMPGLWSSAAYAQNLNSSESATKAANACRPPEKYVKLINDGKYDSVGDLFADDAVYMGPDGKTRHGAKDIGAFYARFLPRLKPQLRASKFFAMDNECMMELENRDSSGAFGPVAVDHFTIDSAGKISRFIVFLRPGSEGTRSLRRALSQPGE